MRILIDSKQKYFINLKNDKLYTMHCEVINATNKDDGQKMILYSDRNENFFVREKEEFFKKFEKY